jgi:AcrR family transcriptional regulator
LSVVDSTDGSAVGPASLRERKKAATRQALHAAVLELAVSKGFDAVTVESIADHANVSRRTFSNYFANKEEALLYGEQMRVERLLHDLRDRPAEEAPWAALIHAGLTLAAELDEVDPRWLAQLRLVRRHPSLLARQVAAHATLERELAAEIARRFDRPEGEPLRSRVLAAVFLSTLRTAIAVWSEQPGDDPPRAAVEAALRSAAEPFV